MRVDLPGFGLSARIPEEGSRHTVASMAEEVSDVIQQSFGQPAVVAGIGLGGEVAAEIAVTHPDLVAGLVMLDVDFFKPRAWDEFVERLPWVGIAATYALETGGPLAAGRWAPNCESGGWCPTPSQVQARNRAETIVDTSESIHFFRRTPAASQVPSKLGEITTPTSYLWSQAGDVPRESVDRVQEAMPAATRRSGDRGMEGTSGHPGSGGVDHRRLPAVALARLELDGVDQVVGVAVLVPLRAHRLAVPGRVRRPGHHRVPARGDDHLMLPGDGRQGTRAR